MLDIIILRSSAAPTTIMNRLQNLLHLLKQVIVDWLSIQAMLRRMFFGFVDPTSVTGIPKARIGSSGSLLFQMTSLIKQTCPSLATTEGAAATMANCSLIVKLSSPLA
ncbi:hypothetical protein HQN89_24220 [Paenibacillus frigoriresistens]|uniref:hypothetical protein n=1 Tax=Paenibacillus alginolyticus TaxID=59839 RepID=UPI001565E1ED|nr:hypothetical protein [Paenibacillus frigoriresistens]NRF94036.1 hypothetical protein [Paenibacillus frigoriresistens]